MLAELLVREGASVAAGAGLARINGLDSVWIEAAIPERDAAHVAAGTPATATLAALPGRRFEGRVEALLPDVDPATRTLTARIVVANPAHALLPGMFPDVELAPDTDAAERVLVPSEAVIDTGTRHIVIVDAGNGVYRAQDVRVGNEAEGRSEILAGVTAGDRVVLSGQVLIDSEANLASTLGRLGVDTEAPSATDVADAPERHPTFGRLLAIDGADWTVDTGPVPSMDMGAMRMIQFYH